MKNKKLTEKLASDKFLFILFLLFNIIAFLVSNIIITTISSLKQIFYGVNIYTFDNIVTFKKDYLIFYLVIYLIALISYFKLRYKLKINFKTINEGQKGNSRFATLEEIKKEYKCIDDKKTSFKGYGGVPVCRYKNKLFIDDKNINTLILGTTRSGKGEMIFFPSIDIYSRAENQASMVVNDPKGELALGSKELLEKRGYDVFILNLIDFSKSLSYNPLNLIKEAYKKGDIGEAQLLCKTITYTLFHDPNAKDKTWQNLAMLLTNALILFLCETIIKSPEERENLSATELADLENEEKKISLYGVANLLTKYGSKETILAETSGLDLLFEALPDNSIAKMQYAASKGNGSKGATQSSIYVTVLEKLEQFTLNEIAKLTSENSIDLKSIGFGDKPVALFIITPDYDSSNDFISSILIRQIYYVLAKNATFNGGKCKRRVVFNLDEFGNMPVIEDMKKIITVCLGRNILFNLAIQSYSQLKDLYGTTAETIKDNCANTIYIMAMGNSSSEEISKLLGDKTITTSSRSGKSLSIEKNISENTDRKPLLSPYELRHLNEGEMVVLRLNRRDKKGNKVTPHPIFCHGETVMKYRYEYAKDVFNTKMTLEDLIVECKHKNIELNDYVVNYDDWLNENEMKTYVRRKEKRKEINRRVEEANKRAAEQELMNVFEKLNDDSKKSVEKDSIETLASAKKKYKSKVEAYFDNAVINEFEKITNLKDLDSFIEKYNLNNI